MEESTTARLLRQIKEACELVGAKTEEYARISRKRLDVLSISREVHKKKTALGERVYDLLRGDPPQAVAEDSTVQAVFDRLRTLDALLDDCEQEIATIREAARGHVADVRRKYHVPAQEMESPAGDGPESPERPDSGASSTTSPSP